MIRINQDNEIINNQHFKLFLIDYFHDGEIISIKNEIVMTPILNQIPVDSYFHYRNEIKIEEERKNLILEILGYNYLDEDEKLRDTKKDLYKVVFKDLKFLSLTENDIFHNENYGCYLSSRFKNSVIKAQLEKDYKDNFYHLRIKTDLGYIDIIFKNMEVTNIPKNIHEIDISKFFEEKLVLEKLKNDLTKDYLDVNKVLDIIENNQLNNFETECLFRYISLKTNINLVNLSKTILEYSYEEDEYDNIWFYSLDVLNKQGTRNDIEFLLNLYNKYSTKTDSTDLFIKAEINDLIDEILIKSI